MIVYIELRNLFDQVDVTIIEFRINYDFSLFIKLELIFVFVVGFFTWTTTLFDFMHYYL